MDRVDCVVVGAGVVGLAVTRAIARAEREVLVIDAAEGPGAGTSGRGSGVIHAGLYYEPRSLKAKLCIAGRDALYDFAKGLGVPYRRLGKLVVATSAAEDGMIEALAVRAAENGVADIRRLTSAAAKALEPALACTSALLSPSTGVIDVKAYLRALLDEAETFGAVSAFRAPLSGVVLDAAGFVLDVGGVTPMRIGCRVLVNAAGHGAPAVARSIAGFPSPRIPQGYFAKGNYFALDGRAPFDHLIYPVPVPGGVGTHLTLDVAGVARFGPDVEWVETLDYAVSPGRAEKIYSDVRRWWPGLPDRALRPSHAGIRPKIAAPGAAARDFMIEGPADHGVAGLVNLFGIESPGLTASLAIGEHVADLLAA